MINVPQKTAIVWTESENNEGTRAANHLRRIGAKVEVREIDNSQWRKSDVEAAIPGYTSLPQIIFDGTVIGDLAALLAHPDIGEKVKKTELETEERKTKSDENKTNWKNNKIAAAAERAAAATLIVTGRQSLPTDEQTAAALARAEAAKAVRAEQEAAREAAFNAAR